MSNQKDHSNLLIGAALAAGIIGTLTSLFLPKKSRQGWVDQAKEIAHHAVEKTDTVNRNLVLGSLAGGLVGVTTALLLAPKAGSDLIDDMYRPFTNMMHKKTQASSHAKKAAHKTKSKSKKASPHTAHHATPSSKSVKAKEHKKTPTKKASAGRKAVRKVVKTIESPVSEIKEAV